MAREPEHSRYQKNQPSTDQATRSKFTTITPPDIDTWLSAHPQISDYLVWERPTTALAQSNAAKWANWSAGEKALLREAFGSAWKNTLSTDPTPYPNLTDPPQDVYPTTVIAKDVALRHYMETIAVCLLHQLTLPDSCSLAHRSQSEKRFLLDSRSLYTWFEGALPQHDGSTRNVTGYMIVPRMLPARPGYMRAFLRDNGIIKMNQRNTIARMIGWCGTLYHFSGTATTFEFDNHWHYRGDAPISRVIEGTIPTPAPAHPVPYAEPGRWTAGCRGTTGLMAHLLRLVNIPVQQTFVCGHCLPVFSSIDCWLSHGDDPYGLKHHPEVSPDQLLVDAATFQSWFGGSDQDNCAGVGRRAEELGLWT